MKAIGATTFAVLLAGGAASAQVGPPVSPGVPPHYPYPGQPYAEVPRSPGELPMTIGQTADEKGRSVPGVIQGSEEVIGQVVSKDTKAKTITVRGADTDTATATADASAQMTLPVDSQAYSSLEKVNTGDEVRLICRTDSTGNRVVDKIERTGNRPAASY